MYVMDQYIYKYKIVKWKEQVVFLLWQTLQKIPYSNKIK